MRLVGGLGLAAPVALILLALFMPTALDSWYDEGVRSAVAAIAAGAIGVSLTALVVLAYYPVRLRRIVRAIEQLADGELGITIPAPEKGRGVDGRLARAVNALSASLAETTDAATVDKLTGVPNRRTLLVELFNEVDRANRYERPLSVAFLDIDHFKAVNDTYGHAVGDIVLRGVAQAIKANLRATDIFGRYGGEEFMLLLTETNADEGALLTEKLRLIVSRQRWAVEGNPELSVTISIGIAGGVGARLSSDELVRDADAAMYSAKALGRNQTYIFAEPDEDARVPRAPISSAGRARAVEIGRAAREAATASLTSVIAPLPHYRGQPSALIAGIVTAMARNLALPEAEVDRIRVAAMLHDVGKVAVPQEILDKPAALNSAEWRSVVQHPRIGQVILEQAAALKDAVPIILHHHERFSGHGYPFGLRGSDIPLGARIVAIADAYDAMTHDRPYKRAISHEAAIAELRRHAGTQFDPQLVNLFCDLFAQHAPVPDADVLAMTAPNNVLSSAIAAHLDTHLDGHAPASLPAKRQRPRRADTTTAETAGRGDGGSPGVAAG
jgi:diguanylate cyclase (GGDEF)-like protein